MSERGEEAIGKEHQLATAMGALLWDPAIPRRGMDAKDWSGLFSIELLQVKESMWQHAAYVWTMQLSGTMRIS